MDHAPCRGEWSPDGSGRISQQEKDTMTSFGKLSILATVAVLASAVVAQGPDYQTWTGSTVGDVKDLNHVSIGLGVLYRF